jgi:hypothetical protein
MTTTGEVLTRKISLTKVDSVGKEQRGAVVGWEHGVPKKGERYSVFLGKGRVLRTSPVEDVRTSADAVLIKTANSIYRVQYLKG